MIKNKLKPEIKRRWIRNLRDRRFRQTKGQLRDADEKTPKGVVRPVCAVGALWEVAVKDGVAIRVDDDAIGTHGYRMLNEDHVETGLTTDEFARWAGFRDKVEMENALAVKVPNEDYDPDWDDDEIYEAVWELNDRSDETFDFPKLAKLIDRGL